MMPPKKLGALALNSLSKRERAVLDLAVAGNTDEQIAQALGITTSTVNSYWVRIRGKIGQLSRTELVGGLLRQEAVERQAELEAENVRLGEGAAALWSSLAQAHAEIRAFRGFAWHLLALDRLPVATLVTLADGTVEYANTEAHRLFGAEPGELEGLSMGELTASPDVEPGQGALEARVLVEGAERIVLGLEERFYALRCDGTNFRAVYVAEQLQTTTGLMLVATIRPFLEDMDTVIRTLRMPRERPSS